MQPAVSESKSGESLTAQEFWAEGVARVLAYKNHPPSLDDATLRMRKIEVSLRDPELRKEFEASVIALDCIEELPAKIHDARREGKEWAHALDYTNKKYDGIEIDVARAAACRIVEHCKRTGQNYHVADYTLLISEHFPFDIVPRERYPVVYQKAAIFPAVYRRGGENLTAEKNVNRMLYVMVQVPPDMRKPPM